MNFVDGLLVFTFKETVILIKITQINSTYREQIYKLHSYI